MYILWSPKTCRHWLIHSLQEIIMTGVQVAHSPLSLHLVFTIASFLGVHFFSHTASSVHILQRKTASGTFQFTFLRLSKLTSASHLKNVQESCISGQIGSHAHPGPITNAGEKQMLIGWAWVTCSSLQPEQRVIVIGEIWLQIRQWLKTPEVHSTSFNYPANFSSYLFPISYALVFRPILPVLLLSQVATFALSYPLIDHAGLGETSHDQ